MWVKPQTRKNVYRKEVQKRKQARISRTRAFLSLASGILVAVLLSLGFILGYDYLTQCDYFLVDKIVVQGADRLAKETIIGQSQINEGMNLLAVNLILARKQLLAHPWIDDAQIGRDLPDRIRITIQEHHPLAVVDLGRRFLINGRGEVFKEWTPADPPDLPQITGLGFADLYIPGKPSTRAFKAVLTVLEMGRKPDAVLPNSEIRQIRVDKEIGLTLVAFEKEKKILLGYGNYPEKYSGLSHTLRYLKRADPGMQFETINLYNAKRVVLGPAKDKPEKFPLKEV